MHSNYTQHTYIQGIHYMEIPNHFSTFPDDTQCKPIGVDMMSNSIGSLSEVYKRCSQPI